MNFYEIAILLVVIFNLGFTILIGLNIIQIREILQPPAELLEENKELGNKGLKDIETSQQPYDVNPLTRAEEQ